VFCDPAVRSRDDAVSPDLILQGWTAGGDTSLPLHRFYHHGSFAEQMLVPTENVTRIGDIRAEDAGRWCLIESLLVPYGGLLAGQLQAGETVVINGATGGFGSAGVAVALAMGASTVVATGRNVGALDDLAHRLGARVRPAQMTGDEDDDRRRIRDLAGGPIDCVLDLLPREASASQVLTAAIAVRPGGRVVLMGGVGGSGGSDLALPYPWLMRNNVTLRGNYMYPRQAVGQLVALIRGGLIDLAQFTITEFGLEEANKAVSYAADNAGALQLTVLRPDA
jgi:alcohol dehydrogenase